MVAVRLASRLYLLCLFASAASCAAPPPPSGVSVVLVGATSGDETIRRALEAPIDPAVTVRIAEPAPTRSSPPLSLELAVASARADYVETADFAACVERLTPFGPVAEALARGERDLAGRALSFLAACHLAAGDDEAAARAAAILGSLDLPIPGGSAAVLSPSAERLLAEARAAAQASPRVPLRVRSQPAGARVRLDGRAAVCTAPCALEVAPGRHALVASLDGRDDGSQVVDVSDARELDFALPPARPEVAAGQWRAMRRGTTESWPSLQLLQVAVGDRRVVLFAGEAAEGSLRLRATLAVDDLPPRRIARLAPADQRADIARAALSDLLREAGVIPPRPIVEEPWFWIATLGGAAIAALITGIALYQPEVQIPVFVMGRAP